MDIGGMRRTDRVMTSIRLLVSGNDGRGSFFVEETRTVVVSRHGARIVLKQLIKPNEEVGVRIIATGIEANMQIIGRLAEQPEGYHYGLRLLNTENSIWGIDFPPVSEAEKAVGRVLLECEECHSSAVVYLNEIELEVFEGRGSIMFPCKRCEDQTSWILSKHEPAPPFTPAPLTAVNELEPAPTPQKEEGRDRRRDKRLALKMKACIRTNKFGDEVVLTENVSKGGFAFKSTRTYGASMFLEVCVPFSLGSGNIFSVAKIAYFRPLPTEGVFAYGVCYLRGLNFRP